MMSGFINNIISRHTDSIGNIKPRLPGKFEPVNFPARISNEEFFAPNNIHPINKNRTEINETLEEGKSNPNENSNLSKTTFSTSNSVLLNNESFHLSKDSTQEETNISHISNIENNAKIKPFAIEPTMKNRFQDDLQSGNSNSVAEFDPASLNKKDYRLNLTKNKDELTTENLALLKAQIIKPVSDRSKPEKELPNTIVSTSKLPGLENIKGQSGKLFSDSLQQQSMSTVIKVSIGRIEVRAIPPPAELKIKRDTVQKPRMSLEDYLKKRNGNK